MPMRLKVYGRNQNKRKEYIHQSGLLITGMDVSKTYLGVCKGTLEGIRSSGFWEPPNANLYAPNRMLMSSYNHQASPTQLTANH